MIVCEFNGAKDAGTERFDPRYDCHHEAVWHLLLAVDARSLAAAGRESVFACEDHGVNVLYSTVMRHRAEPACAQRGSRWRLTINRCVDNPVDREKIEA